MALELPVVKFSENGEYLAYSDPSGILKVWQTSNNKLHREYVPSSHLSATCTCISWAPSNTNREMPVTKKRKISLGIAQTVRELTFIAMGTASGSVLLYSVKNGDLYTMMKDGHSGRVNAICWHIEEDSLFSCGSDHFIVQWSLSASTVKQKWNSGKGEVFSICLCHSQDHLLTAGRVIQLWDWKKKEVLQTFLGHSTEVFHLVQLPNVKGANGSTSNNIDSSHSTIEGSYIISSAVGDNKISVRQITDNSAHKNRDLVCSFSLPEDPVYVDVFPPSEDSQLFRLIAVTRSGKLVFFEHILNGCQRKPLKPKCIVHLVTKKTTEAKEAPPPRSMTIAVAGFARERPRSIVIAYENLIRPVFESLLPSELQPSLEREDPKIRKIQVEESVLQLKQPIIPKDVTVLGPGQTLPMTPSRRRENMKRRRSVTEMTIEERLKAIGPTEVDPKSQKRTVPKADNMAVLLEQGLASGDKTILNNVLQKSDEVIIRNTIMRLKFTAILPLLKELGRRLRGHAQSALNDVNWLKQVIWGHYNYLVTVPDVDVILNPLLSILNIPLHRLQRSITCKQNIEKTLATVKAVKRYQSSKVETEEAVCEFVQDDSDIDD